MGKAFQFVRDTLRRMSPRAVLLLGVVLFLLYAFPGYTSTDSVVQLLEARRGQYSDAHPPLMSAMWRYLDMIVAGPLLMLLLQLALFLGGLYVILRRIVSKTSAAWIAIGLLLFPPIMTTIAVIWKDSQMAAFLMAGIAGVTQTRRRYRFLGVVFLIAAFALRHNALAAVVPLVVILFWSNKIRLWKRLAIAVASVAFVGLAGFAVSRALTSEHVTLTPVWQDIVGTIAYSSRERSDLELLKILRGTTIVRYTNIQEHARKLVRLRGAWRITSGEDRLFFQESVVKWGPLNRAWRELVFDEPGAYLRYHWSDYRRLLGIEDDAVGGTVWNLAIERPEQMDWVEHNAAWSGIQDALAWKLYWLAGNTPLFTPWVYAMIGLLLLVSCSRDRLTFGLIASGLLYELSYFPVSATPDYRYSHWMVTTICLAAVILFIQRLRTRPT